MPDRKSPKLEDTSDDMALPEDEDSEEGSPLPPDYCKVTPPTSKAESATPSRNGKPAPQFIGHLPCANDEAMRVFEQIEANHYQYSTLGRSREALESMTCDCTYDDGVDDPWVACGSGSDCINRLTQVECLEDDCRCRSHCQNQRFQRRQYADIDIVQTDKKGFGLRAVTDIEKDAFIYEYVGDVVSQPSFVKRMRDYAAEGIRHFYFMMLQKDEFIDATKRGGIGRFANHSCSPNSYVAKWTVGKHVRMGIFAKRKVLKDEELTFNYNVDRYGHDAQTCYCGEPNCVGFIGGKTQTDVAAMDDLYLDALGISDEVEMYGLKGSKKRKSKKLDEDYMPILKPLLEKDVPKVVQAVRQTQSRKVLFKLLTRIKITDDQSPLRELMRLRGFSLMCNILVDFEGDVDICTVVLQGITNWPLLHRNKVEDSKIEEPVRTCTLSENDGLRTLAEELLSKWATLEVAYRIPKRLKAEGVDDDTLAAMPYYAVEDEPRPTKRTRLSDIYNDEILHLQHLKPLGTSASRPTTTPAPTPVAPLALMSPIIQKSAQQSRQEVADIIAAASRAAAEAQKAAEFAAQAESPKKAAPNSDGNKSHRKQSKEDKEANKEKKLLKLVGAVVVKCMSKHQKQMDHDLFKQHAKELTHVIAEKEKKSQSYQSGKLDSLSDEKVTKIKKFAKEYIAKVLRKLEKSGQKRHMTASTSTPDTPRVQAADGNFADLNIEDTSLEDDDGEAADPSPATETQGPEPEVSVMDAEVDDSHFFVSSKSARTNGEESGWDPDKPITSKVPESLYAGL